MAALGVIILFLSGDADPLGAAIANGVATMIAIPLIGCVLPALVLAWFRRWIPFALVLELGGPLAYLGYLEFFAS